MPMTFGIRERYCPSVYTRDTDQTPDPGVLAELARRIANVELAVRLLAQGDGGEAGVGPQPVQGAMGVARSVKQGVSQSSGDEPGVFKPPAPHRPGISSDRRPTVDQVGHYNRRLTVNTNVVIASINERNRQAFDDRTGSLRIAS